ncbi:hypothetical protein FB451DRAFT_1237576 [Mycena latifolia]|nr:hypothetical protein FB451DRAFT_1237576 [Mycena latifolia]
MAPRTRASGKTSTTASGATNNLSLLPVPVASPYNCHILPSKYLDRPIALRALSETCRRLRHIFLAKAWERVEVCATSKIAEVHERRSRRVDDQIARELATELVRQVEIITIRNPSLGQHVKTVTVVLTQWSQKTVLPEFFGSLALLPNLETLQVLRLHATDHHMRESNFLMTPGTPPKWVFPAVRTLVVDQPALFLLKCCSRVEHLTLNFNVRRWKPTIKCIARMAPDSLRVFQCRVTVADGIKYIAKLLPNLSGIPPINATDLTIPAPAMSGGKLDERVAALVKTAKKVLRKVSLDDTADLYVSVTFAQGKVRRYRVQ